MIKNRTESLRLVILVILGFGSLCTQAQTPLVTEYQKIMERSFDSRRLSYRYQQSFSGYGKGYPSSIHGKLEKIDNEYLDSNTVRIAVSKNDYYLELNNEDKKGFVYYYRKMAKKLKPGNLSMVSSLLQDTVLLKYGKLTLDTLTDPVSFIVKIKIEKEDFFLKDIRFKVTKLDRLITQVNFTYLVPGEEGEDIKGICTIYDIGRPDAKSLDTRKYVVHASGNDVRLAGKYTEYKVKTIN